MGWIDAAEELAAHSRAQLHPKSPQHVLACFIFLKILLGSDFGDKLVAMLGKTPKLNGVASKGGLKSPLERQFLNEMDL